MSEPLRSQALAGTRWTALATALGTGLQLLQVAVLARLLAPADFGLMALVLVVLGFVQSYVDLGLSQALMREVQDPALRLQIMELCEAVALADGHLAEGEADMLDALVKAWRMEPST